MAKIEQLKDTIVAIATPFGEGAVGIVRLSGSEAVAIADKVFAAKNKKPLSSLKTFSFRYGWIVKPGDRVVDEVIVSLMRGPNSNTKDDVDEINAHGGPEALSSILELVLEKGARLAQPGEFTKRAFLNGRLDLPQAEAVLDIIQAKGDLALTVGMAQLSGDVSRCRGELRASLLELLADMEGQIDFSMDEVGEHKTQDLVARISDSCIKISDLLEKSFQGKVIREGLKVVIYGRPNVGKSSLLNALLRQERAIVTPIAGTTRDTIEEFVNIKGLAVRLIDTAGILEHRDEIEKEALARTRKALKEADLVLFVLDSSEPLTEQDLLLAQRVRDKKVALILNKCDLMRRIDRDEAQKMLTSEIVEVSARQGQNIDKLEDIVWRSVFKGRHTFEDGVVISNVRHIDILKRARGFLETSLETLKKGLSLEFAVFDVKKALEAIGELTGEVFSEDVLDAIFSKFCIGK